MSCVRKIYNGKTYLVDKSKIVDGDYIICKICGDSCHISDTAVSKWHEKGKQFGRYILYCCIPCWSGYRKKSYVRKTEPRKTKRDNEGLLMYECRRCGNFYYECDYRMVVKIYRNKYNKVKRYPPSLESWCKKCESEYRMLRYQNEEKGLHNKKK